jgi:Rieske Fe-S protein
MQRRAFIKSSCNFCLLLTAGAMLPALTGCGPAAYKIINPEVHDDKIEIPLAAFAQAPLQLVTPKGWFYTIAVRKKEDKTYSALLLKCTHQDNQLTAAPNGYTCSLHGSSFHTDGRVAKGPAERPMKEFPITTDGTNLTIHLKA